MTSWRRPSASLHQGRRGRVLESVELTIGCRYDDIKMACIPHLVSALRSDTAERTTWMRLCEVIEGHFKGDLQHVTDTLSLLWKTVSQDDEPAMTTTSSGARSVSIFLVRSSFEVNPELWSRPSLHTSTTPRVLLSFSPQL